MTTEDRTGDGEDVSAPRARGAYPGRRILWILSISLVLVCGGLFGAYALNSGKLASADDPGVNAATARTFNTPAVEPK